MACFDWYGIAASYPRNFAVGDAVKVHHTNGKFASESWTRILAPVDATHWAVKLVGFVNPDAVGEVIEIDGVQAEIVHVDDLKPEAQAVQESALYHEEEYRAGVL